MTSAMLRASARIGVKARTETTRTIRHFTVVPIANRRLRIIPYQMAAIGNVRVTVVATAVRLWASAVPFGGCKMRAVGVAYLNGLSSQDTAYQAAVVVQGTG